MGTFMINFTLTHKNVQTLLNSDENYDLILKEVFLNEAMLGFWTLVQCACRWFFVVYGTYKWTSDMVGTPAPLSYVPNVFLGFTDRMTFLQRLGNAVFSIAENLELN